MESFVVVFLPETLKNGKLGTAISMLESMELCAKEPVMVRVDPVVFGKTAEFKRVAQFWKEKYQPEVEKKYVDDLLLKAGEGSLMGLRFVSNNLFAGDVEYVFTKLQSQTKVRLDAMLVFTDSMFAEL